MLAVRSFFTSYVLNCVEIENEYFLNDSNINVWPKKSFSNMSQNAVNHISSLYYLLIL